MLPSVTAQTHPSRTLRITSHTCLMPGERPLSLWVALDRDEGVIELKMEGKGCHLMMNGLILISKRRGITEQDLIDMLLLQQAAEEQIEIEE